jgi:hypothetical protein
MLCYSWKTGLPPCKNTHEPIRGKGIQDALRRRGFEILLLDGFRTLKVCRSYLQPSLKKFKRVTNPRIWRREEYPMVTCHGLLRCNNRECMQTVVGNYRYWNRDLASVLNYRHILDGLIANGLRPPVYQRPRFPQRNYMILPQWLSPFAPGIADKQNINIPTRT